MNIQQFLEEKVRQAFIVAGAGDIEFNPAVRQATKAQFGDYQINGVMGVAKQLGLNPRQFATQVIDALDLSDIADKIEIAGPGFINIFLNMDWLAQRAYLQLTNPHLNIESHAPQTIVVDYSAPNVAKEMHVGHLRSTIIGDAIVRTLEYLGHNVIRANHIGDWGTQFGMLIANLERIEQENIKKADRSESSDVSNVSMEISDLEAFYRESKMLYDSDEDFATQAREYVVKLQSGDPYCREMWKKLVDITMYHNQKNYDRLNVTLSVKDVMGESMYNPMLSGIVSDLKERGIAVESDGAIVVYLKEYQTKEGDPMGVIIQKKDGAFLYTTTDIASAKYRYETLHADRILYFVDSRQHQHLQQAWSIVRKAGYVPKEVTLEHHAFGMMLGKDGRPFKTRSGGTVRLVDLLDEAERRALALLESKSIESSIQKEEVAQILAMGAVKYADLSKNRMTDYIFDWDNMLSFEGNTAPYMQYAYARISSIFRKAAIDKSEFSAPMLLQTEQEHRLICGLLQFEETLIEVSKTGEPHLMCSYLYHISGLFSRFYEACPIMKLEDQQMKESRLAIAALTAKVIKQSLNLLGIETLEQM